MLGMVVPSRLADLWNALTGDIAADLESCVQGLCSVRVTTAMFPSQQTSRTKGTVSAGAGDLGSLSRELDDLRSVDSLHLDPCLADPGFICCRTMTAL
jgi:hypothetical protein